MNLTFNFPRPGGVDEDDTILYEYEVDDATIIRNTFIECFANFYNILPLQALYIITDYDMMDAVEEKFKDEATELLKERFEPAARERFEDEEAERKDPYGYRGLSKADFY